MRHLSSAELEAGLDVIRHSPRDVGTVEMIVCRPDVDLRKELDVGELDVDEGLVGDDWRTRGSGTGGEAEPARQLTLMSSRCAALVAVDRSRWRLAGDQLYVDLDLGAENLPAGSRVRLGAAEVEVSEELHTGCAKFAKRFGADALRFVNSPEGKALRLRGLNARVVRGGIVRPGDAARKI